MKTFIAVVVFVLLVSVIFPTNKTTKIEKTKMVKLDGYKLDFHLSNTMYSPASTTSRFKKHK